MSEMIDREATVKQICKMGEMLGIGHDRDVTIAVALFVQDDKSAFPTVERPHGMWIPCSERLPDKFGIYLVTNANGVVFEHNYNDATVHGGAWWSYCENKIVAWMPLPEPYKKEGDRK